MVIMTPAQCPASCANLWHYIQGAVAIQGDAPVRVTRAGSYRVARALARSCRHAPADQRSCIPAVVEECPDRHARMQSWITQSSCSCVVCAAPAQLFELQEETPEEHMYMSAQPYEADLKQIDIYLLQVGNMLPSRYGCADMHTSMEAHANMYVMCM